jgi:hypothetical protein
VSDDAQVLIQHKLAEARRLLIDAGKLSCDNHVGELYFMGMVFDPGFGWFTPDGELQEESDWNDSACVIGSAYAEHYGMEGWKDVARKDFGNRGR